MSLTVTIAVLFAALFHASWNALVKGSDDKLLESFLISVVWGVIGITLLPFIALPSVESYPFIIASIAVHVAYFLLLTKSYENGDFASVYPIMRGLPPLLVMVVSFILFREEVTLQGAFGVGFIGAGILLLSIGRTSCSLHAWGYAVLTALMIAAYTVIDGLGARLSGSALTFLVWFSLGQSILYSLFVVHKRSALICGDYIKKNWKRGALGGALSLGGYAIVLWAMTEAPIAYVSALRETSVLFGAVIAVVLLKEQFHVKRLASAALICVGIIVIKLI